jgi:ubiquinone/menaquinone biosynthesis C-methylase UbiE
MRIITFEDIRDVYIKLNQRGYDFILSKLRFSKNERTKSSFNNTNIDSSNYWIIPKVRERWNYLITGNSKITYEEYVSEMLKNEGVLKMLSIGSGVCSHELMFAKLNPSWEILCIDFSEKLLQSAEKTALKEGLKNIKFKAEDIYKYNLPENHYDIVFFHQSLHHFKDLDFFIGKIHKTMAANGKLIINEFVGANRLQYSNKQIKAINQCLNLIDEKYRIIFKTKLRKNKYYGSGILRMIISDPSECIESNNIVPSIKKYFSPMVEKGYGGNLLMPALKDISHHFVDLDEKKKLCLEKLFEYENQYLVNNESDFLFGIYQKK